MSELEFFEHCDTKNPKYLVIFLHGYGSNGRNLLDLYFEFNHVLKDAHYISPNAIEPWEGGFPDCYQWFSLADLSPNIAITIKNSNKVLQEFITKQLKRLNLSEQNLFLIGFSQGAMMSMYQGFIMPQKPAGIISYSGKLIVPETMGDKTLSKPNICLIHGKKDSVLPFANFIESEKLLKQLQIPFESHAFENLDHTIDIHGIRTGLKFIDNILKQNTH